jgi:hypothetical protein
LLATLGCLGDGERSNRHQIGWGSQNGEQPPASRNDRG